MKVDIWPIKHVLVDPVPDDRCNVLAMALVANGRRVALELNVN